MLHHAMLRKLRGCSNLSPAAVLLGTSLNILEAVSIGLLIFPPASQETSFAGLQSQAMSLYIMSTVVSQITLTCGGSSMPSAMGSMLAEALPFLRNIAASIQNELGPGHPGAVGVSLFLLGLEFTLPSTSPHLSFDTLFERAHLPLLAASLGPAILLSLSTRLSYLDRLPKKPTKHPLYVPLFCCGVAGVFWLVAAACKTTSTRRLASAGWLFSSERGHTQATAAAEWDYWALFRFKEVEWRALSAGTRDILLLALIGALSLPIFASAAALEWGGPDHNMNQEFVGHGISNTVAGAIGALPNLFVYSNSRFFHLAKGGRPEAALVALFTLAFFFVSFRVLPYVPTIQASALVLFIGIELTLEALWESTASLNCCEWATVTGTTLACTFLGFAPGVGVGLAIVVLLQFCYHVVDTRPQPTQLCTHVPMEKVHHLPPVFPLPTPVVNSLSKDFECSVMEMLPSSPPERLKRPMLPPLLRFKGRVDSLAIPRIEEFFACYCQAPCIILDLEAVDAVETSVAEHIQSQAEGIRQKNAQRLSIVVPRTRLAVKDDLERGKVDFDRCPVLPPVDGTPNLISKRPLRTYGTLENAIRDALYGDVSSSYLQAAKLDDDFPALREVILKYQIRNMLETTLPEPRWAGLTVRGLKRGETIACSLYPFQPSFVILEGLVAVRQLLKAPCEGTRRKTTLGDRRAGKPARRDCQPDSRKLIQREKEVIFRHILDLDTHGFAPTYAAFELVEETKAKYGICDIDVYNFDEAGFMIGKITTQLVVTGSEKRGRPKSIQPGNREWVTAIAAINAAGWSVPPFIIFAGQYHLSAWYEEAEIPRD
ncbi:hypothetical protein TW65_07075 [Stemphylium lycopersici]|nr:hypothetical protein TW65_07075 [Stemphylium lycopersici]